MASMRRAPCSIAAGSTLKNAATAFNGCGTTVLRTRSSWASRRRSRCTTSTRMRPMRSATSRSATGRCSKRKDRRNNNGRPLRPGADMPYTRKQVKLLLSKASPVSEAKKQEIKNELQADPALGHAKKGSAELKKKPAAKKKPADGEGTYMYNWREHMGRP